MDKWNELVVKADQKYFSLKEKLKNDTAKTQAQIEQRKKQKDIFNYCDKIRTQGNGQFNVLFHTLTLVLFSLP